MIVSFHLFSVSLKLIVKYYIRFLKLKAEMPGEQEFWVSNLMFSEHLKAKNVCLKCTSFWFFFNWQIVFGYPIQHYFYRSIEVEEQNCTFPCPIVPFHSKFNIFCITFFHVQTCDFLTLPFLTNSKGFFCLAVLLLGSVCLIN